MNRLEQLQAFLKNEPEDPFLNYALAMEYIGSNAHENALQVLEALAQRNPSYGATYYHLGKLYLAMHRKEDAEATYRKGIEVTKTNREQHLLAELQSALNELLYDDE